MKGLYLLLSFLFLMSCEMIPTGNSIYRPTNSQTSSNTINENREFSALLEKDQFNKKKINAEVLTYLLNDSDPQEKSTAAVIENTSNCNIIVRLVGLQSNQIYNLPISRNSKNQFVILKGNYTLKSNICGANYYSQKNIIDPLILKLSNN